jgi:Lrp/AsnC family leucine-responsive transcriptional regulator
MDKTDFKIIAALQENAKLSTKELAAKLNLSRTPTYERVKKLEDQGIIEKYVAKIGTDKLKNRLVVYAQVSLQQHTETNLQHFENEVMQLSEVKECVHISGSADYLLKIIVDEIASYRDFISQKLSTLPHINQVQSNFVLKTIKHEEGVMVDVENLRIL